MLDPDPDPHKTDADPKHWVNCFYIVILWIAKGFNLHIFIHDWLPVDPLYTSTGTVLYRYLPIWANCTGKFFAIAGMVAE
jgi:hypothetical protein